MLTAALWVLRRREHSHLEGSLAAQTLENDGADAPQVSLGIVVLRHDDLWGLRRKRVMG